ncbi:MAG: ATP-binding cassette domain-containing protein [Bryobacteraceae bacterium]|jgi:ABC-2 type transport system ATP-binding protein
MGATVKTNDLRKIYNTPPPLAAPGSAIFARGKGPKKPKMEVKALDGVSLEVGAGEIFGLLGPNGAGKSTTVGILTTRVKPTSGDAWIGPHNVWREQVETKRLIGVVQQRPNLDFSLSAREILLFHAAYFGIGSAERTRRAAELLERFQLTERAEEIVRGYSGGMMQRLAIARAMMHDPDVLFLDEPSTGLDPQTRLLLWEIIREYNAAGKTILLTTHNMEEADALCQRIAIVDHGKVIAIGTPAELKHSVPGGYLVRVKFSAPVDGLADRLRELPGVNEVKVAGSSVDVYADSGGALVGAIAASASNAGVELSDVHISEPSLENLFLHHTGRSLRQ